MATGDILILGTFHANTQDEVLVRAPQVQGTYIVVPDTTAMNAITNEVAIDGTLVYVVNAGTTTEGVTYGNTYRKVNGAWAEELMPLQVQNVLSERINDLNDDVDDLKKDIEDLAKQDETILIGLTEITNIKNDITVFKTNVTNKFIDIDNTFVNINIDIDKKFGAVNEDIDRIEGALSGYERVLNLQNAKHNEDGTVVHNGSVTSEGFTYNYTDEETNEDHEVFIEPPTVDGYGSMMIGGYRYDAGELIGTESEDKHKSFSYGNQTFGAGGGVQLWGDWDVGFGKNTTAYQKATFVMGGGSVAGMTKEEFVERWKDDPKNATVDKTVDGWEDLIVDQWGSTYDKSYSFAASIGEVCLAKGRGTFSFGSRSEAWGTYALSGGYKAIVKTKDFGIALGYNVQTLGEHGINIGSDSILKGTRAINIGSYNNNSSPSEGVPTAGYVTMIGNHLTTVRPNQIALGRYNMTHNDVVSVFQVADGNVVKTADGDAVFPYDVIGVYKTNPDTSAAAATAESLYGNKAKYTVEIKGNVNVTKGQGTNDNGEALGHGGKFTADYIKCWTDTETNGVKFPITIYNETSKKYETHDALTITRKGITSTGYHDGIFGISVIGGGVLDANRPAHYICMGNNIQSPSSARNVLMLGDGVTAPNPDDSIIVGTKIEVYNNYMSMPRSSTRTFVLGHTVTSGQLTNAIVAGSKVTVGPTADGGATNAIIVGNEISVNAIDGSATKATNAIIVGDGITSQTKLDNVVAIGSGIFMNGCSNLFAFGSNLTIGKLSRGVVLGQYNQNISLPGAFVANKKYNESIFELGDGYRVDKSDGTYTTYLYNPFSIYKSYTTDANGNYKTLYGNNATYTTEFKTNVVITKGMNGGGNGGSLTADVIKCWTAPTEKQHVARKIEIDKIRTWNEFYWHQNDFEVTTADKSKVTFVPTQNVSSGNPALRVFVNRELRLMSITGRLRVTVSAQLSTTLNVNVKYTSIKKAIGEEGVTDSNSGFMNMTAQIPIPVTYSSSSGVEIVPQGGYINMFKTGLEFKLFETYVEPRAPGQYMFNVNATFFY
jgi:hypothetical protein